MTVVKLIIEMCDTILKNTNDKKTTEVTKLIRFRCKEEFLEMEKKQIIDANINGSIITSKGWGCKISKLRIEEIAEQYYNETFKKNKIWKKK